MSFRTTFASAPCVLAASVAIAALGAGCKRKPLPATTAAPVPAPLEAPATASTEAAKGAKAPPAGPAGWAYVVAQHIVAIDPAGKVSIVKGPEAFAHLVRASDGNAYALLSGSDLLVARLKNGALERVGTIAKCGGLGTTLDARGDRIVVDCDEAIYEKRGGGAWTTLPRPAKSDVFSEALAIGKDGTLWLVSGQGAFAWNGAEWAKASGTSPYWKPNQVFEAAEGGAYVATDDGVFRASNGALARVDQEKPGRTFVGAASNGLFGFFDERDGLTLRTTEGEVRTVATKAWLAHANLDDAGRAWAVNDGQIQVVDPTSGALSTVPMGAYPELDELTVSASIVALGAGPALPPARPVRRAKSARGKLVIDRAPAAGAEIEICPRSGFVYQANATPCSGVDPAIAFRATADAKGEFSFADVPIGHYYLHYKPKDADHWFGDSTELPALKANAASSFATLAYESAK